MQNPTASGAIFIGATCVARIRGFCIRGKTQVPAHL
eukprot:COSAG05_NODE_21905_length_268_cov_0.852071_1_plen_35_part_01